MFLEQPSVITFTLFFFRVFVFIAAKVMIRIGTYIVKKYNAKNELLNIHN
jgi:hypothetical protein